jgi:hypothetical protein
VNASASKLSIPYDASLQQYPAVPRSSSGATLKTIDKQVPRSGDLNPEAVA